MLKKPHQGLTRAAEVRHLVTNPDDRLLHAAIWIFLEPVPHLDEADRGGNDQFPTACLLVAGRERALTQKIELVFVETPLQPQKKPVIALTGSIDRLLVDQDSIDDAAHLDELLPVTAVAGKPRYFACCNRTDLAQADLGNHSLETGACDAACGRATEVIVDCLDA